MKKILILLPLLLTACGVADDTTLKIAQSKKAAHALTIARQSGCLNCHNVTSSIIGPAWVLVADRYKSSPDAREMLIEKVKKGGNGSWNDITGGASMPAHEKRLSHEHIALIVDFILSLKHDKSAE
ncbi:MAG TPA: c-type cytochrome [Gammaproteobacteria bacterium]|nr:c-type cytochrome [Gammaproteobacteria bacterium]